MCYIGALLILLFSSPTLFAAGNSGLINRSRSNATKATFAEPEIDVTDSNVSSYPKIEVEQTGHTESKNMQLVESDTPLKDDDGEIRFLHRADFDVDHSDLHHEVPTRYINNPAVEGQKRKGLAEHLMLGLYSLFTTKYMSREYPCSIGPVWQPSATIELYKVGFNVWANFVLNNDEANEGQFNEVDLTLYYTATFGSFTAHPAILAFLMPNGDPASLDYSPHPVTLEADLYLSYDIWKFTISSLTRAGFYASTGQVYSNIGLMFTQPILNDFSFMVESHLSFGNGKFLTSHAGGPLDTNVDALAGMIGLTYEPVGGLTFQPNVRYAVHVTPSIRRVIRQNPNIQNFTIWGGMDVNYSF